jgi:hypothetical protein
MSRARIYVAGAAGLATIGAGAAVAGSAFSDSSSEQSAAPLPATSYSLVGGSTTTLTAPQRATTNTDAGLTVRGYYNEQGELCVAMASRDAQAGMEGCSAPDPDGRQTPPAVVLPTKNGTLVAGLAPDDVSTVQVVDEQGAGHKVKVTNNGWTAKLAAGRQVARFDLEHANGRAESLGGQ